jgi:drug/metabolite transporter (DMT)-like permease
MILSALCFAAMNILFISAMALGPAANAIYLQYSAPLWMFLAGVLWLGETADRRGVVTLFLGMTGIAIVVVGGGFEGLPITLLALASGLAYAGVVLCLRALRDYSPAWLTVWNHLWSGIVLLPLLWSLTAPTWPQFIVLMIYGGVQMALPYWLMARSLKSVSPQEAGTISLLEPILNPVWAFLVSPETEVPSLGTLAGGAVILGALAWRYWPSAIRDLK